MSDTPTNDDWKTNARAAAYVAQAAESEKARHQTEQLALQHAHELTLAGKRFRNGVMLLVIGGLVVAGLVYFAFDRNRALREDERQAWSDAVSELATNLEASEDVGEAFGRAMGRALTATIEEIIVSGAEVGEKWAHEFESYTEERNIQSFQEINEDDVLNILERIQSKGEE